MSGNYFLKENMGGETLLTIADDMAAVAAEGKEKRISERTTKATMQRPHLPRR
jgi:hypothetical protein